MICKANTYGQRIGSGHRHASLADKISNPHGGRCDPQDCRADRIPNAIAPLHVPKNPAAYAGFYSDNFTKRQQETWKFHDTRCPFH